MCRKADLDYFYQGNAADLNNISIAGAYAYFPEAWAEYVAVIAPDQRHDMIAAYADIFALTPKTEEQRDYQNRAATAWSVWEGSTSYLAQDLGAIGKYAEPEFAKAFARIENHYFMNGAFLGGSGAQNRTQNYILENLSVIRNIPIAIVHGRYDQVCPLAQAEALVTGLHAVNAPHVTYRITNAGHSMLERETAHVLTEFMDNLAPQHQSDKVAGEYS